MKRGNSPGKNASEGLLEKAIEVAVDAHAGQKVKNGRPYILHPLRVMLRGQADQERIAGVMHDVVEHLLNAGGTQGGGISEAGAKCAGLPYQAGE